MALMSALVSLCQLSKKPSCTLVSCIMTAAYTAEEASVQTASRPGSPVGNSSDSDADAETGPALTSSSPAGNAVPLRTSKQQRRAVNSQLRICQERLMNTEVCDNGGSHKLTKACGGLFVYLPSPGKMTAAATSKLDSPFRQRGCLSLIDKLAEEHAWSADGSQSDPSLFAIVQALLTNMLGTVSQQPDLLPMSGEQCCSVVHCAMICCYADFASSMHSST